VKAYVLIGGRSRRMGDSKAALFLDRLVAVARPVFDDVIAVQRHRGVAANGVLTIFEEAHEHEGPVFGLVRALQHAKGRCFVMAVDFPVMTTEMLEFLRDRGGVPVWDGRPQPLCAVWDPSMLPRIEERIAAGKFDLQGLVQQEMIPESELRARFPGAPLSNVNTPQELSAVMAKDFSHLDETGGISMVHVGAKKSTQREAVAAATVRMAPATLQKLMEHALPKGDVLTTAKVAGVLAAKQTPTLIPLAHPIAIDSVDITFDLDPQAGTIELHAIVRCEGKTGVEMEAMTACAVAALTIYDMCKSAEKGITIEGLQLLRKSGGKSGVWER
jgi:cyclic pyranopterin phosphate synthase